MAGRTKSRFRALPIWTYALLACDCIRSISEGERTAKQAQCFGRHRQNEAKQMQPIVAFLGSSWRPYRCGQPAPAKEAWQLTKAEFTEQAVTTDQSYQDALTNTPHNAPISRESAVMRAEKAHTKAVLDALKAGNDVPYVVLADYDGWHKLKKEPAAAPLVETPAPVIDQPEGSQLRLAL